jgi:putative hydrolase of the HAD superfamily
MHKHIFFDLDRTLWDFAANSQSTLEELFSTFNLKSKGIQNADVFIRIYKAHNEKLWELYRVGKISQIDLRRERFQRTLADFGLKDFTLAEAIGEQYISICPTKNQLYPFAIEALDYLSQKYKIHIITNGFHKVQHLKLKHANLTKYFDAIITSEKAGVMKPNPKIFEFALETANAKSSESVYVGDDLEVDILGCQNCKMDGIYFNPDKREHSKKVTFEITCLSQLMEIL